MSHTEAPQGINTVVFGGGNWLSRLSGGLRKAGLEPDVVVGNSKTSEGQERLDAMGLNSRYISPDQFFDLEVNTDAKGFVLSRNADHVAHGAALLDKGIRRTFIDKPLGLHVTDARELAARYERVGGTLKANDHYLSAKARTLEILAGKALVEHVRPMDSRKAMELWSTLSRIGAVQKVSAMLVEGGADPHGGTAGRGWLEDPRQGGVMWDLAIHLFAIGARLDLFDTQIKLKEIKAETYESQTGSWRQITKFGQDTSAELYTQVKFENAQGVPVEIAVGKIGTRPGIALGKSFVIQGEKGIARLDLAKSHTEVQLHTGERFGLMLVTDPYELIIQDFVDTLSGTRPDNVKEALTSIQMVEMFRDVWNESRAVQPSVDSGSLPSSALPTAA